MEISYYFECFSYKADYDPKCLRIDVLTAEFSFQMQFDEDYNDILSSKSTTLLKDIEPLLKQSFGVMEINLSNAKIRKGSVIIVEELRPIRNSVPEIKLLLNNDKNTCEEFLGVSDETTDLCWHKNTEKIFREKEFKFLGVSFDDDQEVSTVSPSVSPTTSKPVVSTTCITKIEESVSVRRSPKFQSTQSTIKYRSSCQGNNGPAIKTTTAMVPNTNTFITSTLLSTTSSIPPRCSIASSPDKNKEGYN